MNPWLASGLILIVTLFPCGWLCISGRIMARFAGLQMAQVLSVLIMVMMAEGYQRSIYLDLALVLSVLSLASALVYVRFLERWV